MSNITLTASMRSNLASLKGIQGQMDTTQTRLSTGKKVNSAIDNASSFYQARSLSNRAADLDSLLDSMGQGIQTIQAASEGIEAITSYIEQAKSVADAAAALDSSDATAYASQLANYKGQFNAIVDQIGKLAEDASYQGVNLLKGNTLKVVFNEGRTHDMTVTGDDVVAKMAEAGIGFTRAAWEDADDVAASLEAVTKATNYLRDYSSKLGNNFAIIETRQNFTEAMIDVLETGADNLVLADMNEESANYLALQTRQQLAINSLALASQSAQSVLKLF